MSRLPNIKLWNIGLNIQQRGPIEDVNILNVQGVSIDTYESHDRNANGIGAIWGSGGEYAVIVIIQERFYAQRETSGAMKMVD